jgi:hypothetical protein
MHCNWLTVRDAAKRFGYGNQESLRRRLRQLRKQGLIIDIGNPPRAYGIEGESPVSQDKICLFWVNSTTMLIHKESPNHLLNPKRGKRSAKNYD